MSYREPLSPRLRRLPWPSVGRVERSLWLVVGITLAGDLLTTYVGLNAGLTESNPVARAAISQFGFVALVAVKAIAVGIGVACRPLLPREYTAVVPAGLALPWVIATLLNLSLFV
ncbi:DUF5658 family protein [Halomicrococcus gelatinilyticus]|uniref:DUF5658 family protein n=1 Tax=Halomicrococcus gelatinilyticus TaxID=1702103 RepID=UPI002E14DB27